MYLRRGKYILHSKLLTPVYDWCEAYHYATVNPARGCSYESGSRSPMNAAVEHRESVRHSWRIPPRPSTHIMSVKNGSLLPFLLIYSSDCLSDDSLISKLILIYLVGLPSGRHPHGSGGRSAGSAAAEHSVTPGESRQG